MAPVASKANYKSYEAQARLVRAIVAAHPNTKWNYKGKYLVLHFPPHLLSLHALFVKCIATLCAGCKKKDSE